MSSLREAIDGFSISSWCLENLEGFRDTGGERMYGDCPVCGGRKKLKVTRLSKFFYCYRCAEGGHGGDIWDGTWGLLDMICFVQGVQKYEAVREVFRFAGLPPQPLLKKGLGSDISFPDSYPIAPVHPSFKYLESRGVAHLIPSCRVCVSGRYSHRIIIPAYWLGQYIGWEAKAYTGQSPKALYPGGFEGHNLLYSTKVLDFLTTPFVIVTESILDAETLGCNAIGMFGSSLTPGKVSRLLELREFGVDTLYWFLDWDAFRKAARYIVGQTAPFFRNFVVKAPKDMDPNDLGMEGAWKCMREDSYEFRTELDFMGLANHFEVL